MGTHPIFESDFDCLTEKKVKMELAEEAILGALSPDEIASLVDQLEEMDPENELLPAGHRQPNQTDKKEMGIFNRDALIEYLEEQARSQPEVEDFVPHVPGQKKGKVFQPKNMKTSVYAALEPDIEAALGEIEGVDLSELAEILGETAINSHVELGRRGLSNNEETGLRRIYRPDYRDPIDQSDEPELNPADIEEDLRRVQEQDPIMTRVNWNNLRETPIGHLVALFRALEYNQHVTEINIANTRANDMIGQGICKMLKSNETVEILNVESNFITSSTMADLVHEACKSHVLTELRIDNQRNNFGEKTEHLFCDSIAEGSDMLQKLSYSWRCPGPRQRSQVLLMTNQDQARIRRNQAKQ